MLRKSHEGIEVDKSSQAEQGITVFIKRQANGSRNIDENINPVVVDAVSVTRRLG
jgi:hypothetical protein